MSDDFKENVMAPGQWVRILYMIFFAVVSWLLGIIITVVVIAQALISLITGKANSNLRKLGILLSRYFIQILLFLTYASQVRPFPFSDFPSVDPVSDEDIEGEDNVSYAASDTDDVFADMSFTDADDDDDADDESAADKDSRRPE